MVPFCVSPAGASTDERIAMITVDPNTGAATSREYYHANRLGSVIAMADETGTLTAQYVYTPFGVEDAYNASGNPFRYTGRRLDAQWGIYYYRARYYDPQIGRFLETDPAWYVDSMNLYAYVGNDPVNNIDPTGMCKVKDGAITECDVIIDEDLSDEERETAEEFLRQIAIIGQAIQDNGSPDQKDAWEGVVEIRFTNDVYLDENGNEDTTVDASNRARFARTRSKSATKLESARIRFYKPAYDRVERSNGSYDVPYMREVAAHEIWHGTVANENHFNQEQHAVRASDRFLKRNGLQSVDYHPRGYRGFF